MPSLDYYLNSSRVANYLISCSLLFLNATVTYHMLRLFRIDHNCSVVTIGYGLLHDLLCDKDCRVVVRNLNGKKNPAHIFCVKNVTAASCATSSRQVL